MKFLYDIIYFSIFFVYSKYVYRGDLSKIHSNEAPFLHSIIILTVLQMITFFICILDSILYFTGKEGFVPIYIYYLGITIIAIFNYIFYKNRKEPEFITKTKYSRYIYIGVALIYIILNIFFLVMIVDIRRSFGR